MKPEPAAPQTTLTWCRTGSRTWRVEIVRPEDREAVRYINALSEALTNSQAIGIGYHLGSPVSGGVLAGLAGWWA